MVHRWCTLSTSLIFLFVFTIIISTKYYGHKHRSKWSPYKTDIKDHANTTRQIIYIGRSMLLISPIKASIQVWSIWLMLLVYSILEILRRKQHICVMRHCKYTAHTHIAYSCYTHTVHTAHTHIHPYYAHSAYITPHTHALYSHLD